MNLKNAYYHFKTITRHRHLVIKHCFYAGILWRGLLHDLSKYTPAEFFAGMKYYTDGTRSPNEKERELLGYSPAWMHHKGRNRHHFEYWTDYNPKEKKVMPVPMPIPFLKELICDRVAASKIYQGTHYTNQHPLSYFLNGDAKISMAPETARLITEILTILAEEGEKAMFEKLRAL